MTSYGVARACPFPAGHDMWAQYIVSYLKASEHAQVLSELLAAIASMPGPYLAELDVERLVADVEDRLDALDSPF